MSKTFKVNRSGFEDRFSSFRPTPFLPYVRFRSPPSQESSVLGFRCVLSGNENWLQTYRGGSWVTYTAGHPRIGYRGMFEANYSFGRMGLRMVRRKE